MNKKKEGGGHQIDF